MTQMYVDHPLEILESRLDWLSVTVKPGQHQTVVKGRVAAWIDQRVEQGYNRKAFQTPFYRGTRVDGIAWGERTDDSSVTLSGSMAQQHGPTLITWADTISRCDVQVTLRDPNITRNWASYVNSLAGLDDRVKAGSLTTRLYTRTPDGTTAYIGDGASDRMMRVYDKYAESGHHYPVGSWRWEVQYRHQRAAKVARRLLDDSCRPSACLGRVCDAFHDLRIDVPALCLPARWNDAGITPRTDNERRLAWLKTSVAPCVERLTELYGMDIVLDALGLNAIIDSLEGQQETIKTLTYALEQRTNDMDSLLTKGLVRLQ